MRRLSFELHLWNLFLGFQVIAESFLFKDWDLSVSYLLNSFDEFLKRTAVLPMFLQNYIVKSNKIQNDVDKICCFFYLIIQCVFKLIKF
jgi:hypothetical protein